MNRLDLKLPYGRGHLTLSLDDSRVKAILEPRHEVRQADLDETALVEQALAEPIDAPRLSVLAGAARRVLILTSDHTRPVPSRITLPILLREIRSGNPAAEIRILVGTGFHRLTRPDELEDKFGRVLCQTEQIIVHDSRDRAHLVHKGQLPSGGELWLNDLVDWADLVIAEGFIEPHFFAGFSGGRKSVLPGIAAAETVLANHCAEFIASPLARSGNLAGNPLHRDMLHAARTARLAFILNVALDADKRIIQAFAGHPENAHLAGCAWVGDRAAVRRQTGDIVITSNGGYPLDQNIYQAVKGMTAAEACVRPGGVIIMAASCEDGHGGEEFWRWFAEAPDAQAVTARINAIDRRDTLPDQWEAQILARILEQAEVILVTDRCDPALIRSMHLSQADTLAQALALAEAKVGAQAQIVVIPDGVAVIVRSD
jgi:nickel-dependent lactate racemase